MATHVDTLAQKQAKQKKILIGLGVVLLALAAFQGPKLWKQLNGSSAPAAAPVSAEEQAAAAAAAESAAGGGTPGATPPAAPDASLAGLTVGSAPAPSAGPGQLRTFSLFSAKDPFLQSLPRETSGATTSTGTPTLSDTQPGSTGGTGGGSGGASAGGSAGGGGSAPSQPTLTHATIAVNGTEEPLAVKEKFPARDKIFVLVSLKPKSAKIAVAGGRFTDGQAVTLKLGDTVTLVNTATGARYTLELLYTGSAPEEIQEFSQGAAEEK